LQSPKEKRFRFTNEITNNYKKKRKYIEEEDEIEEEGENQVELFTKEKLYF
jgi:hypothetical protein